jgi:hypothetical protein
VSIERRVAVLAGRRIDFSGTEPAQFPPDAVANVRSRIGAAFASANISVLVSSAACGADLIGLDVAEERRIRTRIVLPFAPDIFRARSVDDRPGEWGIVFERAIASARGRDDLVEIGLTETDGRAYMMTNRAILDEGLRLAPPSTPTAFVIWDGPIAGRADYTADFVDASRQLGAAIVEIPILG